VFSSVACQSSFFYFSSDRRSVKKTISRVSFVAAALVAATSLSLAGPASAAKKTTAKAKAAKSTKGFPVTVKDSRGPVKIAKRPTRIVSLSPTATESLFAIGAGKQVIAVDDQSNFPANVPTTKLSGFTPNLEAIVGYKPDLVVIANDTKDLSAGLAKLKLPVLLLPAANSLDDVYSQIEVLGAATGHLADSAILVSRMRADITSLTAKVVKRDKPLTFFHELDDTFYSVTSKTFIGSIYTLAGLSNIADAADKDSGGYPQLTNEYIVAQNPDFIFLADTKCCKQSAQTVGARAGWADLASVKNKNVIALDDDIASRWGPRVVDQLRTIVEATTKVAA
jgi:iron complex transport system substrate-binding protein